MSRYLDVEDRVAILNNRLDIIKDLLDSLGSQLEIREAHRLEKTIIWLIVAEIALDLIKETALPAPHLIPGALLRRAARLLAPVFGR